MSPNHVYLDCKFSQHGFSPVNWIICQCLLSLRTGIDLKDVIDVNIT